MEKNDKKEKKNQKDQKDKEKQIKRVLDIYTKLCEGKVVNKAEAARYFGVAERTIQRDVEGINAFLSNKKVLEGSDMREIESDSSLGGYVMKGMEDALMSNSEILAVSKILLESRAFTKEEIDRILKKMVSGCVPRQNMKLVSDLISNEQFHYVEIHHESYIKNRLWEIGSEIRQCNLLEITYQKQALNEEAVVRVIQPLAILFSEYYFYLNANIVEPDEKGEYVQKYDYPAVFRIDRIREYKRLDKKFKIWDKDRFEEGEFRKRIQFMYMGRLGRLKFKYTGNSLESVLERLPTAKVMRKDQEGAVIEAEVYGRGVLMWLLTQGSMVEVLGPPEAREEMKQMLSEMLSKYIV